jgi:ABC-type sugar transport system substrate-binding protein
MLYRTRLFAAGLAFVAVACGSDDGSSAEPATTDAAETTIAVEDPDVVDSSSASFFEQPTEIGPTVPLESQPEPKTVAWLECELTGCLDITPGFEAATAALGWDLEVIGVQSFDPAPGFQQAIDLGVDYIALTGTPAALIQDQIDAAAAAGIAFFSCYSTDEVDGPGANIWMQCVNADTAPLWSGIISNAVIDRSDGAANVLLVNLPDFPILVAGSDGARAAFDANCPDCTFNELPVTIDQLLAGDVPAAVVSALQNDPSITHLYFNADALATGVADTLDEAGLLEGLTLVGSDFNAAILQEIVDGKQQFWLANPKPYAGWLMVDGMARHSIGQANTQLAEVSNVPTFLLDDPELAADLIPSNGWPGPDGMEDQFKALWDAES